MNRNIDIDLLRTFVAIVETRSLSRTGERLLRSQSTISVQLKRLEDAVGKRLLDRSPHAVRLTPEGETLFAYALRILALNDELVSRVNEPQLAGHVRLGTPEDFATSYLPGVLAEFAKSHPLVSLEVRCDLTLNLTERHRRGEFDVVLVKREPSAKGSGVRVWREPLVWVSAQGYALPSREPLPLVVSPEPCVYRKRAVEALERARRPWRVSYTCASLAGQQAAVRAGLGVTVLPKDMAPEGFTMLETGGLPNLPDTEIALLTSASLSLPAKRLREHIIRSLEHAPRRTMERRKE
jgi:DNA-binding transcriptional LysR family regulator